MNWKGYVVLALLVLGVGGFFGERIVADKIQEQQFRSYEGRIEAAVHDKFDVTDIDLASLAGVDGNVMWIYLYGEGATQAPLTEKEFAAVDEVFTDLVRSVDSEIVVWAWIRPGRDGSEWNIITATVCETAQLLASRENPELPAGCQTQQMYRPLEAKHLRWLNE